MTGVITSGRGPWSGSAPPPAHVASLPFPARAGRPAPAVQVAPSTAADLPFVLAMTARCSRETLFHRFHGFTDGGGYIRGLFSGEREDAMFVARSGLACVGLASLDRDGTGVAHVGVLVEDAWQRQGIGSLLLAALADAARARRCRIVHADVLGEDNFIVRMLRRVGPLRVSIEVGTLSVDVDVEGRAASRG
jgi:GNAT superfamily N-acetyltransferase